MTAEDDDLLELPAWSLADEDAGAIALRADWPHAVDRAWAWGGSTGRGVRVCVVDSGIDATHPLVGAVQRAVVVRATGKGTVVEEDTEGDVSGHGTACAGIVRALAPDCDLVSVRVLGAQAKGGSVALLAGLEWAIAEGFEVINLSLSTRRRDVAAALHHLADRAYFGRSVLVASAHNLLVQSFPWRFASVISVGSHEREDPEEILYNPTPPVEFFARGINVEVAWPGGATLRTTGNSFATPHVAARCALILAQHPGLTPFELKHVLFLTAGNVA